MDREEAPSLRRLRRLSEISKEYVVHRFPLSEDPAASSRPPVLRRTRLHWEEDGPPGRIELPGAGWRAAYWRSVRRTGGTSWEGAGVITGLATWPRRPALPQRYGYASGDRDQPYTRRGEGAGGLCRRWPTSLCARMSARC